jgi:hypothetical protein
MPTVNEGMAMDHRICVSYKAVARVGSAIAIATLLGLLALAPGASASSTSGPLTAGLGRPELESPNAPKVSNLSPETGPLAGGTAVKITGADLTGASAVDFGTTPASFSVESEHKIDAVAPPGEEGTVDVTVTTPEGTSATVPADHFFYLPDVSGPIIAEVSPDEGAAEGGTKVKIIGARLQGATAVSFGEVSVPFEMTSPEQIHVVVPPVAARTVDVRVTTPEGVSAPRPQDEFTYITPHFQISTMSPTVGPAAGGTTVTIGAQQLFGISGVDFGQTPATSFTAPTPFSITAVAPPHTALSVIVHVETVFGLTPEEFCVKRLSHVTCSVKDRYTYNEPTITGISPASGPAAGGTPVTITGTGFALGEGGTAITTGKTPFTSVDCTSVSTCTALTPAHKAGKATLAVRIDEGEKSHGATTDFLYE